MQVGDCVTYNVYLPDDWKPLVGWVTKVTPLEIKTDYQRSNSQWYDKVPSWEGQNLKEWTVMTHDLAVDTKEAAAYYEAITAPV